MSDRFLKQPASGVAKSLALFPVLFLLLSFFGPDSAWGGIGRTAAAEHSPKRPVVEWEGSESELKKPFAGVIDGERDWKDLWKKAFGKKAPVVNFKRYAVACVFLGHYPGWWYRIGFSEPESSGSSIVVRFSLVDLVVELMDNGKRGLLGEYGTRGQYRMRLVERKQGCTMRIEQDGKPQISLKRGFDELLDERKSGVPDEN